MHQPLRCPFRFCPKGEHELAFPDREGKPIQSSDLLAAGVDVVTVSKVFGHSNPHITFTVYAHAIPKERHGAGDALARLMAQSGNKMETSTPEVASVA